MKARAIAKALVSENQRYFIRLQWRRLREQSLTDAIRWNVMWTRAWLRDRVNRRHYHALSEDELRAARRSDTVFVFGSGASLNALAPEDWAYFQRHDVLGFNLFYYQHWIPVGFHILRGGTYGDLRWRPYAEEVVRVIDSNPLFGRTIFLMQDGYTAEIANQLIGDRMLATGTRVFRYHTARSDGPPTRAFREGIRHTTGTLADAVNIAFLLGWTHVVLVGVDLYDSRYFFLPGDQTVGLDPRTGTLAGAERSSWRGHRYDEPHNTAQNGVVELMADWRRALEAYGVELTVYNPRSLLAEVLPIHTRPEPLQRSS